MYPEQQDQQRRHQRAAAHPGHADQESDHEAGNRIERIAVIKCQHDPALPEPDTAGTEHRSIEAIPITLAASAHCRMAPSMPEGCLECTGRSHESSPVL